MDTFHLKYLKYKNKYKTLKNKIVGGANCPKRGYTNHRGECWHDALSTCLLYSDVLSEHIQSIFDNPSISIDTIIKRHPSSFKPQLLPINIEPENNDEFLDISKEYITSLRKRYLNDKLPTVTPLSQTQVTPGLTWTNIVKTLPGLVRQNSTDYSLDCVSNIFEISNINNIYPHEYIEDNHGGTLNTEYITIATVNYFLTSYNTNKFINASNVTLDQVIIGNSSNILKNLNELKLKIQNAHGILLGLVDYINEDGHGVSLIKCNDIYYFYDDNGVYDDGRKNLSRIFNWKDELISRVDTMIFMFTKFLVSQLNNYIKTCCSTDKYIHILSDFFTGKSNIINELNKRPQQLGSIGKSYLSRFTIENMIFLTLEDIPSNITIGNQLQLLYEDHDIVSRYTNKKNIEFIRYLISTSNIDYIFNLLRYSLINNNLIVAEQIINDIINNFPKGVNTINSIKQTMLFIAITVVPSHDDNIKTSNLKKTIIRKLIRNNIDITIKNKDGNNVFSHFYLNEMLRENEDVIDLVNYMEKYIINKLIKTVSLTRFYQYLKHDILKHRVNKRELTDKYIAQYKEYHRNLSLA